METFALIVMCFVYLHVSAGAKGEKKKGRGGVSRSAPGSMIYYVLEESRYAAVSVICVSSIVSGSPSFLSVPLKVVSSFAGASSSTWVSTNEPLR